jgi:hypothetical protein
VVHDEACWSLHTVSSSLALNWPPWRCIRTKPEACPAAEVQGGPSAQIESHRCRQAPFGVFPACNFALSLEVSIRASGCSAGLMIRTLAGLSACSIAHDHLIIQGASLDYCRLMVFLFE